MHQPHVRPIVGELLAAIQTNDVMPGTIADAVPIGARTAVSAGGDRRREGFGRIAVGTGDSQDLQDLFNHDGPLFRSILTADLEAVGSKISDQRSRW